MSGDAFWLLEAVRVARWFGSLGELSVSAYWRGEAARLAGRLISGAH